MKTLGTITATFLTALTAGAAVVLLRSIPDIRRYLKMRQM